MNQIIYVAIGPDYLRMALRSAASALANGFPADGPPAIVIVTDQTAPNPPPAGVTLTAVATPSDLRYGSREYKTRFLDFATADQVLFLDADTLVNGDISALFRPAGIAMVQEAFPSVAASPWAAKADYAVTQTAGLDAGPLWNSGVLALGNDAAGKALCAAWHTEWLRFSQCDQLALLRAMHGVGIVPTTLDQKFNDRGYPPKSGVITHWVGSQRLAGAFRNG